MRTWSAPAVPSLSVAGPSVSLFDTTSGKVVEAGPQRSAQRSAQSSAQSSAQGAARLYVCGITPYDATHMGHAATYVAYDLLNRAWRNAGHDVVFVQNVTDVDDPLLERAAKVHVDWQELAERETQLFRDDMEALRVLPPEHYIGAVESIPLAIALIERLQAAGATYTVDGDLYFSVTADDAFGDVSRLDRDAMLALFGERGGDPDRAGKKDPLDCVLWLAERPDEPSWESPFGRGRPGWHIECSAIALEHLGHAFDVQAGGNDLVFPHHEMSAGHAQVAHPSERFAKVYSHAGMVGYDGEKMSKSKGNLVFVSALRNSEVDPMAIRLTLLRQHYRSDWEWTDGLLWDAVDTLDVWRPLLALEAGPASGPVVDAVLAALANDLDAPTAVAAVQDWMDAADSGDRSEPGAPAIIRTLVDATLGLDL